MVKRAVFLLVIFSLLVGFNFFLIDKVYSVNKKQTEIEKILAEISQNRNESKQFQVSLGQTAPTYETDITVADGRVANLKSFFRKYGSPLYNEAEIIVKVSDQYQFDYRLLPAIAMQESNLCRVIPHDSYNCWGWGIYGTTVTRFESYEQAIKTVAKGISENYIDEGLVTASAIMQKYTPSSNGSWQHGVNTFLKALE